MAEKIKSGKRKGIEVITTDAKASKKLKVEKTPKASKNKVFKPEHVTAAPESPASGTQRKTTRKRAADMFDLVEEAVTTAPIKTAHTQTKSTKKSNKAVEALEEALDDFQGFESGNGDDEEEIDTSQLLAGFESSDESGSEADDRGIAVEKLPRPPKANGATVNEAEERRGKAVYAGADEPGTLYIGHIPHGFYERQMHAYFSQFGTITRLRLARNKRTGAPKHYAFIEFASADVADIVQRTMDKYLLFDHILQVRKMAPEQVHANMWKGSESRFKVVPWGAIQGRGLKAARERGVWKKRVGREEARREKRKAISDEYGYEFSMPKLKQVDDVAQKGNAIENGASSKAIESGEMGKAGQDGGEVKAIAAGDEAVDAFVGAGMPQDEIALKQKNFNKKTKRSVSAAGGLDEPAKKGKKQKKGRVSL